MLDLFLSIMQITSWAFFPGLVLVIISFRKDSVKIQDLGLRLIAVGVSSFALYWVIGILHVAYLYYKHE